MIRLWRLMTNGTLQLPSSSALRQAQPHHPASVKIAIFFIFTIIIVVIVMMRNQTMRSVIIIIIIIIMRNEMMMLTCCWQEGRLWLQLPASLNLSRPLWLATMKDHHHHQHCDDHYHDHCYDDQRDYHYYDDHGDHVEENLLPLLLALSRISSELSPPMLLHWLNIK